LAGHTQDAFWKELLAHDWVLHSARQDIEVVYQTAGAMPASIFDTQVAAALLGMPAQMGYAGLVKELFDVEIHKMHTRADWSRRPLRHEYLEYAAEDVEYLLPACELLTERLEEKGRLDWAREDSAWLLDPDLYVPDASQAIDRLKGARNFRGARRAAAARLATWRESEAVKRDRPRQWIMRDNVLLDIAWKLPQSEQQLADVQGVPAKLVKRVGSEIVDAIARSAGDGGDYQPPRPPDESQKTLLKTMQKKVATCAGELGIAAETLASKRELSAIIIGGARKTRVFGGWRAELIGNELAELLPEDLQAP
jgi:ribonuclease D